MYNITFYTSTGNVQKHIVTLSTLISIISIKMFRHSIQVFYISFLFEFASLLDDLILEKKYKDIKQ